MSYSLLSPEDELNAIKFIIYSCIYYFLWNSCMFNS